MIKKFSACICLFLTFAASAQQGTASPYSFYGIGEIRFKGTAENRLMGGVSVFSDSIHINLQNPASYSSLKLTSFTVGGSFNSSRLNSFSGNEKSQRTTVDYLAVGLPIGKLGAVFGLIPYASVGYRIRTDEFSGDTSTIRKLTGNGGVNKAFLGFGYQFTAGLSVGADISYNFGRIETTNIKYISDLEYGTEEYDKSDLSGVSVNIGAMYKRKINQKIDFYGSLVYTPESNLKSENTRSIASIVYIENFTPGIVEYLDPVDSERTLKLPNRFSIGAGIGQNRKWLIGTEVTLQQTNSLSNRFADMTNATFENSAKYSVGGYYIPNYLSFSNYFDKIVYRAGFRYERTGLVVNGEPIKDYAFTAGFGFPLGGTFSNLNVGVELGRKGTAKANLVEENYLNAIISISLNDKWFVKRKYD